jgi:hypothetical protein
VFSNFLTAARRRGIMQYLNICLRVSELFAYFNILAKANFKLEKAISLYFSKKKIGFAFSSKKPENTFYLKT